MGETLLKKESMSSMIYEQGKVSRNQILLEFILQLLDIKNQGNFSEFASKVIGKFFGINIESSKLVGKKNVPVDSPPLEKENIEPNVFYWEPFKKTSFSKDDLNKFFIIPVDDKRANKTFESQIIFLRPLNIVGDKVEVKFTINNQGEANVLMNDTKYYNNKKVDLSLSKKSPIFYGIMENDMLDGLKLIYVSVDKSNNKSYSADVANIDKPSEIGKSIFKIDPRKFKLSSGETKFIEKGVLVRYDDKKVKQSLSDDSIILSGEVFSDQLKSLPTTEGKKLYDTLIEKGRDKDFKYW